MKKLFGLEIDEAGWFEIADREWLNRRSALLLVDMQSYAVRREWALIGTEGTGVGAAAGDYYYGRLERVVVPALQRLLGFFRGAGLFVVHVRIASQLADGADMPALWKLRMSQHARDSGRSYSTFHEAEEMQIVPELAPLPGEPVLTKTTGNAFTSTNLEFLLKARGVRSLVTGGVWLNSCVEDTIRVAADLGYLVTLVEDGAAAGDPEFHRAAVRVLGSMYCSVRSSDRIIALLERELGSR